MNALLGVGGGIAAYKAAELARALMERGFRVEAVMTRAAQKFITPLTFSALTGNAALSDLFSGASPMDHIAAAQRNDVLVIAPATADLLARLAHGLADDLLTTLYLVFTGPVVLAPAMNTHMWQHAATQKNVETLRERGHLFVEPEEGMLACGATGPGRLADPSTIADRVASQAFPVQDLAGETVLITAGPTQEPIDPVRFMSNRSSGKMGFSLAEAAARRGAKVILVSGPVQLPDPPHMTVIHVRTALEMRDAVLQHMQEASIIIKSAAVADYQASEVPKNKIKKTAARLSLELDPTPDILAEVGRRKDDRLLIGFAAETGSLVEEARRKLESKNCDLVVANLVGQDGTGFESDENEVVLVPRSGPVIPLRRAPKREIAERILDQVLKLRLALHAVQ